MSKSAEIFKGSVVGAWEVIADAPTRINGVLQWRCRCEAGHEKQIPHPDLQFGVVPSQCAECSEQAWEKRAAAKREEQRVLTEASKELALRTLAQMKQAQVPVAQIEGVAQPDTHTRALQIPAQPEAQGEANAQ